MTIENKISGKLACLKETILNLIPPTGQYPMILINQARNKLFSYYIGWDDMQTAFDNLYNEGKIFERPDFTKTILKRAYKSK